MRVHAAAALYNCALSVPTGRRVSTQKEKMLAGELYQADDPELQQAARRASLLAHRYKAL